MSSKYSKWNRRVRKSLRELTYGSPTEFEEAQRIREERWNYHTNGPTKLGRSPPSDIELMIDKKVIELENRKLSSPSTWTPEDEQRLMGLQEKLARLRAERGAINSPQTG